MPNITNTLSANISATEDSTSNVIINRSTGSPAFDSTSALMLTDIALVVGNNVLIPGTLGVATPTQLYVKNNSPAGQTIAVTWTAIGQAAAYVTLLYPGDQIILWQKPGGASAGIQALTLTTVAAGALAEYFIGA